MRRRFKHYWYHKRLLSFSSIQPKHQRLTMITSTRLTKTFQTLYQLIEHHKRLMSRLIQVYNGELDWLWRMNRWRTKAVKKFQSQVSLKHKWGNFGASSASNEGEGRMGSSSRAWLIETSIEKWASFRTPDEKKEMKNMTFWFFRTRIDQLIEWQETWTPWKPNACLLSEFRPIRSSPETTALKPLEELVELREWNEFQRSSSPELLFKKKRVGAISCHVWFRSTMENWTGCDEWIDEELRTMSYERRST